MADAGAFAVARAGYLPSFWIKLRMLNAPAINSVLARQYPVRPITRHQYACYTPRPISTLQANHAMQ